ncbi:unnamed protein product [Parascedosporium putredinis]|uniref:Kelch repeat-containing protein n=1 Tax=Parascedosporium putredinis TaxID=1442378 RepID=A0A9P1M9Y7_9PEZI|nr:unnamed protein product [Parascedosporium putredinis]CAI7996451.1 unnamed protein product [Parascedosporium putredinis]
MCLWKSPRVITLRDTVYLDGESILWLNGMDTGNTLDHQMVSSPTPVPPPNHLLGHSDRDHGPRPTDNPTGLILTLNLTTPFRLDQNLTQLFGTLPKSTSSSTIFNYIDGDLLGNDAQFFTYGGLTRRSDSFPDPDPDDVLEYQAYPYESNAASFKPGFVPEKLPPMSRATSLMAPANVSDTLITLEFDPEAQNIEKWSNVTLPESVLGRAGASGVFVPAGKAGALVFVGGVTHPEFASKSHRSDNPAALKSDSEAFLKSIDVYDIESGNWYRQETSAPTLPPITALGCAVVQHAIDFSSFNIYYYGGYAAEDLQSNFHDDVWILTMPSFQWIKAKSGSDAHARGHKCVSPYPDQMMAFGGFTPKLGTGIDCVKGGVIQLLNLTSVEWMDAYSPADFAEYGVPEVPGCLGRVEQPGPPKRV